MSSFDDLPNYDNEGDLQEDLKQNPNLIRRDGESAWHYCNREFEIAYGVPGVPHGRLDILSVREDGLPALIEAKRYENPEIWGPILAQMLSYRRGFFRTNTPVSLQHKLGDRVSMISAGGLARCFAQNQVRLVLAVDRAPIELVIAAAGALDAGVDIDLIEIRRGRDKQPVRRFVSLKEIDRSGDWRPLETILVAYDQVSYQKKKGVERARLVPVPTDGFRVLADRKVRPPSQHQVDPSRPEGMIGVMPNLKLLAETGNPYPIDPRNDRTVMTDTIYLPWIKVARAIWKVLGQSGCLHLDADKAKVMAEMDAAVIASLENRWNKFWRLAFRDTLLDLALYSLVTLDVAGSNDDYVATRTNVVPDWTL